jgi:hypothetical protein
VVDRDLRLRQGGVEGDGDRLGGRRRGDDAGDEPEEQLPPPGVVSQRPLVGVDQLDRGVTLPALDVSQVALRVEGARRHGGQAEPGGLPGESEHAADLAVVHRLPAEHEPS